MKKQRPQNLKRQVEDKIFLHVQDKNLEKNKDPKIWKGKWGIKFLKMNKDPKIYKGRWGIKYFTKKNEYVWDKNLERQVGDICTCIG